jgi:hypothetical protein
VRVLGAVVAADTDEAYPNDGGCFIVIEFVFLHPT